MSSLQFFSQGGTLVNLGNPSKVNPSGRWSSSSLLRISLLSSLEAGSLLPYSARLRASDSAEE